MLVNESVAKANIKKWNILKTPLVGQNVTQKIYLPGLLEHLTKDWLENWEKKSMKPAKYQHQPLRYITRIVFKGMLSFKVLCYQCQTLWRQ